MYQHRKILSVGHNLMLLESSASVLASAGYAVRLVTLQDTLKCFGSEQFEAIVLCHTLENREANAVRDLIQGSRFP